MSLTLLRRGVGVGGQPEAAGGGASAGSGGGGVGPEPSQAPPPPCPGTWARAAALMRRCCWGDSALGRCLRLFCFSIVKTQAAPQPDSLARGVGAEAGWVGGNLGATVRPGGWGLTPRPRALSGGDSEWVSLAGPYREGGPGTGPRGVPPALASPPLPPVGGN